MLLERALEENNTLRKKLREQKTDYDLLNCAAIKIRNKLIVAEAELERKRDTTRAQTRLEFKSLVEAGTRSQSDENLIKYTHLDSKYVIQHVN